MVAQEISSEAKNQMYKLSSRALSARLLARSSSILLLLLRRGHLVIHGWMDHHIPEIQHFPGITSEPPRLVTQRLRSNEETDSSHKAKLMIT